MFKGTMNADKLMQKKKKYYQNKLSAIRNKLRMRNIQSTINKDNHHLHASSNSRSHNYCTYQCDTEGYSDGNSDTEGYSDGHTQSCEHLKCINCDCDTEAYGTDNYSSLSNDSESQSEGVLHADYHSDDNSINISSQKQPSHVKPNQDDEINTHNEDLCTCHLPDRLHYAEHLLTDKNMLIPLIKILDKNNILDDFIGLIQLLSCDMLYARNLPLLCALDRSNFERLQSTTNMSYFPETLEFWQVVRRTCKGAGLLLFSGLKHAGHVSNKQCSKSYYDPKTASINFAVPHWQTLANNEIEISKYIQPGIIKESFKLLDPTRQYILEFDAKSVSRGLQPNGIGDINLWGHEGPPNLQTVKQQLHHELDTINEIENMKKITKHELHKLNGLLQTITCRIKEVRQMRKGHQMLKLRLIKMSQSHPKNERRFNTALGSVKGTIYQCDNWIDRALKCNLHICKLLAHIHHNDSKFFEDAHVNLEDVSNVKFLNEPDYITSSIDLKLHPQFIKQRTTLWHEMRNMALVTGSTCYNALGLSTLKEQKKHFRKFILDVSEPSFDEQTLTRLQHGIDNEVKKQIKSTAN